MNALSTTQIVSFIICLIGKVEGCYVIIENAKYRPVIEQTQNNCLYMNWPTDNDWSISEFDQPWDSNDVSNNDLQWSKVSLLYTIKIKLNTAILL